MDVDRCNTTGFVVPVALGFLVALCRRRCGLGGDHGGPGSAGETAVRCARCRVVRGPAMAVGWHRGHRGRDLRPGRVFAVAARLSETIAQSIHYAHTYCNFNAVISDQNVAFRKGALFIPDEIIRRTLGYVPYGFCVGARSLFGYGVLVEVVPVFVEFEVAVPHLSPAAW